MDTVLAVGFISLLKTIANINRRTLSRFTKRASRLSLDRVH